MIIDTGELTSRRDGLNRLLRGYRALISSPDTVQEVKNELNEGIINSIAERDAVAAVLAAIDALVATGYPDHAKEQASQAVIDALADLAADVALVPLDFASPALLADNLDITVA